MKNKILVLLLFVSMSSVVSAQDSYNDAASIGVGLGLDYGGIGLNGNYYFHENVGAFLGVGYNFLGLGYNIGTKFRYLPHSEGRIFSPYGTIMYGYTTVIAVQDMDSYNKTFYGATLGLGFDYRKHSGTIGYWSFGLLIPIRGNEVDEYIEELENKGVKFGSKPTPIGITIGYKFIL